MCAPVSRRIFDNGTTCSRSFCVVAWRGAEAAAGAGAVAATGVGVAATTGAGAGVATGAGADGCVASPLRSM